MKPDAKPNKRPLHVHLAVGFLVFSILLLIVLWLFQTVFLESFYKTIKTAQVKSCAYSLSDYIGSDSFSDLAREIEEQNAMTVNVYETTDSFNCVYSSSDVPVVPFDIYSIYQETYDNGGENATITQVKTFDGKSRICQNSLKKTPHLLILGRRIGKGCDQQTAGLLFPVPPQFLCQSVCRVKTFKGCRCAAAVGTRGAAGQKKYHSVPVLSVLFYMSKLISCLLLFMFPVLYVFCSLYLRFFMPGLHYTFVP